MPLTILSERQDLSALTGLLGGLGGGKAAAAPAAGANGGMYPMLFEAFQSNTIKPRQAQIPSPPPLDFSVAWEVEQSQPAEQVCIALSSCYLKSPILTTSSRSRSREASRLVLAYFRSTFSWPCAEIVSHKLNIFSRISLPDLSFLVLACTDF